MDADYSLPLSEAQQEELLSELKAARREAALIRRKLQNLEKANEFLVVTNENNERIRDIHEKELTEAKQIAEDASLAKGTFLAQMSHEMRTPMNAIKVLSELLLRTDLDSLQKDYANNIVSASSTLLNIINDILDFSKLDADKFEIAPVVYDFSSMIDDVGNIINLRALDKNIAFLTDIDDTIPSLLEGDDLRIKQIMLNLLQNAVKFTNEGHIKLSLMCEPHDKPGYVTLMGIVEDSGIGVTDEDMKTLFQPFAQADKVKNRTTEGTGLGLSICKNLLELMGGGIEVSSVYGKGSTFTFWLPQRVEDSTPIAQVMEPQSKYILVAGDPLAKESCLDMIERMGMKQRLVSNTDELKRAISEEAFTHILYDFETYNQSILELTESLEDVRLICIKDIRYAAHQQTPPEVGVLFDPILVHEIAKVIEQNISAISTNLLSESDCIGSFLLHDTSALIVDDNEVNLMVMNQLLNQYNIDSVLAKNGMEAIEIAQGQRFDVIFMDHMMPIMNGVEATNKIRAAKGPNKETPIIIVTANAIVGMKEEFLQEGLDDYISKPIEIKELNEVLRRWLPEDKIEEKACNETAIESNAMQFVRQLSEFGIESIAVCEAMGYSADTYKAIVDTFLISANKSLAQLEKADYEEDIESFRIHVHGVKSALANIGADRLSQSAERLEVAAQDRKQDMVHNHFPKFANKLRTLIHDIVTIQEAEQVHMQGGRGLSSDQVDKYKSTICTALDELDSLSALDTLEKMKTGLSTEQLHIIGKDLVQAQVNIENFDHEAAIEQLQAISV